MPLRARQNGNDILSFNYSQESWAVLKASYKTSNLMMPCCESKAIPKTSHLGNFYFAHLGKGDCSSEPESQEHIWVKSLVAKAAIQAGWDVKTEWCGESSNAEKWIADVYCTKNKVKIAFEIQLSRQTNKETRHRQLRYKNSGVRCAWFASELSFKNQLIRESKNLPFFLISSPIVGIEPTVIDFSASLSEFVIGMLTKKLNWVIDEYLDEYGIYYIEDFCYNCNKKSKQIYGYGIDIYGDEAKTIPNASDVLEKISRIINNQELKSLGLNAISKIEVMKGKVLNYPYCNTCLHCDAPQNNYHLMQKLKYADVVSGTAEFTKKINRFGKWVYSDKK